MQKKMLISSLGWPEFPLAFVTYEDANGKGYFMHGEIVEADPRLCTLFPKIVVDLDWQRGEMNSTSAGVASDEEQKAQKVYVAVACAARLKGCAVSCS
jgi:hypothetical protein